MKDLREIGFFTLDNGQTLFEGKFKGRTAEIIRSTDNGRTLKNGFVLTLDGAVPVGWKSKMEKEHQTA